MHTINNDEKVDILEDRIFAIDNEILKILLTDKTTKMNIKWCTDNYSKHGVKFEYNNTIELELITGKYGNVIKPRTKKSKLEKKKRIKEKAEVFTPSWTCNHQINLIDEIWFNQKNVFNFEIEQTWLVNKKPIEFPSKTWQDYVLDLRIEITCGEAPYVVSRYDSVTGNIITPINRIGILDRKIRVINENSSDAEWYEWIKKAYQSVYGYEWQGDSLLIARENLLYTFIDYYQEKFRKQPSIEMLKEIAEIISWNFWQMDGQKCVVPLSCNNENFVQFNLFGESVTKKCYGCENQQIHRHNGTYCKIKDWTKNKIIRFIDLVPRGYY